MPVHPLRPHRQIRRRDPFVPVSVHLKLDDVLFPHHREHVKIVRETPPVG
jgi:hypothetical protein